MGLFMDVEKNGNWLYVIIQIDYDFATGHTCTVVTRNRWPTINLFKQAYTEWVFLGMNGGVGSVGRAIGNYNHFKSRRRNSLIQQ